MVDEVPLSFSLLIWGSEMTQEDGGLKPVLIPQPTNFWSRQICIQKHLPCLREA